MKKTLIRALSFCMILALLTGLMAPFASAIDYEGVEPITLEAAAGLLIDLDTDQVLYEQNADGQRYPASITKIMTALLTLEAVGRGELDLSTVVTVDAAALKDLTSDSSTANLKAGEEITVHDLLYCLMLASANEAANILAMTVCGDIPTFVERMNQRAQELGMTGTHFMNPHGLHNSEHYSTAWDIYRMAKEAMTHAAFREIVSTARYVVPATNMSGERVLLNTNALLTSAKFPGYTFSGTIGIKTGSTGGFRPMTGSDSAVVIAEGIHMLNPIVFDQIRSRATGVYVAPRTRIITPDDQIVKPEQVRVARRMIRDYLGRGHSLRDTIERAQSVDAGERKYIQPNKPNASVHIDSFHDYELCILAKDLRELPQFTEDLDDVFIQEKGLSVLMSVVSALPPLDVPYVPRDSIIREFVGGSCFEY